MTRILRQFVEVPDGQAHYRTCGDPGFPPLVMFHGSPGSSYSLVPLMQHLAKGRHVYAIDTLGNGDSSPAIVQEPDISYLAEAHFRATQAIGLKGFDIYGYHTGTAICAELSIQHGDTIRRIVMDGLPFDSAASANLLDHGHAPDIRIDLEGTQFLKAWSMVRDAHLFWPWWDRRGQCRRALGLPSAEYLHGEALEVLKACRTYYKSYRASLLYPGRQKLPQIRHSTLVCACRTDQLFDLMNAAAELIPNARKRVTPERETDADLAATARIILEFLG
jgi:pimeloyl-ACP methyl ester carboxylesterase